MVNQKDLTQRRSLVAFVSFQLNHFEHYHLYLLRFVFAVADLIAVMVHLVKVEDLNTWALLRYLNLILSWNLSLDLGLTVIDLSFLAILAMGEDF